MDFVKNQKANSRMIFKKAKLFIFILGAFSACQKNSFEAKQSNSARTPQGSDAAPVGPGVNNGTTEVLAPNTTTVLADGTVVTANGGVESTGGQINSGGLETNGGTTTSCMSGGAGAPKWEKGVIYRNSCWYLGSSCTSVCANRGGVHDATFKLVGSEGGAEGDMHCMAVANLIEPIFSKPTDGSTPVYFANSIGTIGRAPDQPPGIGCAILDSNLASKYDERYGMAVIRERDPTKAEVSRSWYYRVCSCRQ